MTSTEVIFDNRRLTITLLLMIVVFYLSGDWLFRHIWSHREPLVHLYIPLWVKALSFILAIVLHEGIHGLIFALYAPGGFRSVRFGFNAAMGAFYCHCTDAVKVKHYRRAGIAPLIILGLIPYGIALYTGIPWLRTFGLLLTVGGFGDLLVYIRLWRFDSNRMVRDHPEKLGFILEDEESGSMQRQ